MLAAYTVGTIDGYAIAVLTGLYATSHIYFQRCIASKMPRAILLAIILATSISLSFHLLPGFHNALVIDGLAISPLSIPFSMYLNFDKTTAGIILLLNSGLYANEKSPDVKSIATTSKLLCLCSAMLMMAGLLSGYIRPDFKIPAIALLWSMNNLFFVCLAEEVVFRGIIQSKLDQSPSNNYLPLTLSSLLFGLAHFKGGIPYVLLASIAGGFYGLAYQKTRRILCSMLVHFGLNFIHLIFFTYPAAIETPG